jgi:hypothetical protein
MAREATWAWGRAWGPLTECFVGVGCGVQGVGCRVWGAGCGMQGVGCRVWDAGCGVQGVGAVCIQPYRGGGGSPPG